jgi:long-chain acyl-CoA synthetase
MIVQPFLAHALNRGDEIAIRDDSGATSYSQLAARSAGLAAYLVEQTARPAVGVLLPSSAAFASSFYGILLAGKAVVPLNFLLGDREIRHVVADSGIDTVLAAPPLLQRLEDLSLNVIDVSQLPAPPPHTLKPVPPPQKADAPAVLLYTSGTNGLPKGVELSYGNLHANVAACIDVAALQQRHVFLGAVPLFHAFGLTATLLAPMTLGAPIVYLSRFSPVAMLNAIREHAASIVFAVPSMFAALLKLKDAGPESFRSIHMLITGGEPLQASVRDAFAQRFDTPLYEGYGLTETSPVIALNTPARHRPGSVGQILPNLEIKIVAESGEVVPRPTPGELLVRGPSVMRGYHHLPDETARAITTDGFFRTGDIARVDDDGFLFITGRLKDLIIVAGEKVYPREVEEVLQRHPSIADVAVLGRRDAGRGETVAAFVVARDGQRVDAESIRAFCRSQGLPNWKTPRDVIVTAEIPRSPTGKVLKQALAAQLQGETM